MFQYDICISIYILVFTSFVIFLVIVLFEMALKMIILDLKSFKVVIYELIGIHLVLLQYYTRNMNPMNRANYLNFKTLRINFYSNPNKKKRQSKIKCVIRTILKWAAAQNCSL
jgi:hypothetical protein